MRAILRVRLINTHTLTERTPTSPFGSAVNAKEERAMAAKSAIMQDESSAETLLIRENILCIYAVQGLMFVRGRR